MSPFHHPWLDAVVDIAVGAGDAIMAIYPRDFAVDYKADQSPLTEADRQAHHRIAGALRRLAPEVPQLSEEDCDAPGRSELGAGTYWLIDPLDGTREFVKKNGEFTVNIALIKAGRPILGVVHAPALGCTYAAAAGDGAFKRAAPAASWRPIRCGPGPQDNQPWRVVGSRSHGGDSLNALLQRLGSHELIPMGSSLKLCLVAEDAADLYPRLGPTSLWDTAAAHCVVEGAGGEVTTLSGTRLSYADTSQLLNPHFLVFPRTRRPEVLALSQPTP